MNRGRRHRSSSLAGLGLLAVIALSTGGSVVAEDGAGTAQSAWDAYVREHPEAMGDETVGPIERRMLQALTPEQAAALAAGTDPSQLTRGPVVGLAWQLHLEAGRMSVAQTDEALSSQWLSD